MLHFWSAALTLTRRALRVALRVILAQAATQDMRSARAIPVVGTGRQGSRPAGRVR